MIYTLLQFPIRLCLAVWAWIVIVTGFSLHALFARLCAPFSSDSVYFWMRTASTFLKVMFALAGIRYRVEGLEHYDPNRPLMLVSNHMSHLDILAFMVAIPGNFAFVAKQELLKVPVLGTEINFQKHILINRANIKQSFRVLQQIPTYINNGRTVVIFPEGTRSKTGELGPFHRKSFSIAIKHNLTILPACILGTNQVISKHSFFINPGSILIRLGKPISIKTTDSAALMSQVRTSVSQLMSM